MTHIHINLPGRYYKILEIMENYMDDDKNPHMVECFQEKLSRKYYCMKSIITYDEVEEIALVVHINYKVVCRNWVDLAHKTQYLCSGKIKIINSLILMLKKKRKTETKNKIVANTMGVVTTENLVISLVNHYI